MKDKLKKKVVCHYCNNDAVLVTGKEIYPKRTDLYSLKFWRCTPCDSYVGCHKGGISPLGILANSELRMAKRNAHSEFDELWKLKYMPRKEAYRLLSEYLEIPIKECHIGMFQIDTCKEVITFALKYWESKKFDSEIDTMVPPVPLTSISGKLINT